MSRLKLYAEALILAALTAALGATWGMRHGRAAVQAQWDADKAVVAAQLAAARAQADAITTRVVTQYVDRVQVVHERGATIVKRVPVYVTAEADRHCIVPRGFVRVHDAAAAGAELPATAESAAGAASGVALSAVAGTVSDNYATCHETAARLIALQQWAVQQSEVSP